jgi:putative acetyltransferase
MTFSLRRLTLEDMDRAAVIHRTSFDEGLPWLAGLHTAEEDRTYFRGRVFASCQLWGAVSKEIFGIIASRQEWIDQLYVLPSTRGKAWDALFWILQRPFGDFSASEWRANYQLQQVRR